MSSSGADPKAGSRKAKRSGFLDPGRAPALGVDQLAPKYAAGTVGRACLAGKQVAVAAERGLVRALVGFGCVRLVTERCRGRIGFAESLGRLGGAAEQDIGERRSGERGGADFDKTAAARLRRISGHCFLLGYDAITVLSRVTIESVAHLSQANINLRPIAQRVGL